MTQERRRSRRNRSTPTRQRMVDPDAWTPDDESSPHPAAEELPTLPVPTPSSSTTSYNADDALQPLITQPADPVAAAIARRQNTVVTVTSTQFSGSVNPNGSQQDDGIPIGTIAASVSVGVFLAVGMPSARPSHKNQTSTSSVAPLNGSTPKTPARRSREKQPGLNPSAPPSHARSTSGGPPGGKQQQRRPGQPAMPPPAVLPPTASTPSTTTPPKSKRRSPPGSNTSPSGRSPSISDSASLTPTSPASTLVEEPSSPRGKGGVVVGSKPTSYTPQKPSPLALGAERAKPKEKPKEKSKVNEWGMGFPVSAGNTSAPSSPTSSGHGHESTTERGVPPPPVPPVPSSGANAAAAATNAGRRSANLLAIPEPAAHFHSRRDRISVLSDSSYYALEDEEDGPQDVYMGVALGGDEPSPIPEEYFSPNYEEEEEEDRRGSRMQRQQEDYFSSGRQQGTTYGGYGYQQQQQQPSSQYRSQGGYGYGYGGNQQSYGR
ncbi:hypothetical protein FRC05_000377 [Tulasnella sp. 425]|nr:hypothetical protein FRC05_000377 [Tulasnella sp. 425]